VSALEERLGTPVDSYVNGTQAWLTEDGPHGITLEWRLHPVAAYRAPAALSHYELWDEVVAQLTGGRDPGALALGEGEPRPLASLWDGLEAFAPYDDLEPANLAQAAGDALDRPPDASGMVDHERIGDAWEKSNGEVSLVALLLDELQA